MAWPTNKPASGIPARGYRWPPFEKGNTARMTNGAQSPRRFLPIAEVIKNEMLQRRPDLADPTYEHALQAWAVAEAQAIIIRAWCDEHGMVDPETGQQPGYVKTASNLEAAAARRRAELGLDPQAHTRLIRNRAEVAVLNVDLQQVLQRGRDAMERRAARERLELEQKPESA